MTIEVHEDYLTTHMAFASDYIADAISGACRQDNRPTQSVNAKLLYNTQLQRPGPCVCADKLVNYKEEELRMWLRALEDTSMFGEVTHTAPAAPARGGGIASRACECTVQ